MTELDRRRFLVAVAATVAVTGISWYSPDGAKETVARADVLAAAPNPLTPMLPRLLPPPGPGSRVMLPGGAVLDKLPGNGDLLAWTVDGAEEAKALSARGVQGLISNRPADLLEAFGASA